VTAEKRNCAKHKTETPALTAQKCKGFNTHNILLWTPKAWWEKTILYHRGMSWPFVWANRDESQEWKKSAAVHGISVWYLPWANLLQALGQATYSHPSCFEYSWPIFLSHL